MKKILMFAVALALPLLFSCNKDKKADDPGSSSIPTGASFSNAVTYENDDLWITFNGDNNYIAGEKTKATYEIIWGTYKYANNVYTIYYKNTDQELGTIKDLGNKKVYVKIPGKSLDTEISVEVTRPSAGNDSQRAANHTWKPVSLTLIYGALTFNSSKGVDLNEFENWAVQNEILRSKTFSEGMIMQNVFVSDTRIGIIFGNGKEYIAKFDSAADLANFTLSQVEIKDATGDFSIFEGNASVSFSNGKCVIEINGRYQGGSATAILTLSL